LLDRVRRQTRTEVIEGRSRSLNACPPDFHDNPPSDDNGTGFSNHTQVPGRSENAQQGFSSSQEVSDYLPQPYKGAAWDEMDDIDNDIDADADADAENPADFMDVRGAA
jgi:hypothetical protein